MRVLAVFAEFDAEALEGAGVQAVEETFDHKLSPQIKAFDLIDDFRFEVFFDRQIFAAREV